MLTRAPATPLTRPHHSDGSAVCWGADYGGCDASFTAVQSKLQSGVGKIYSTSSAFAAVRTDGTVVTWGSAVTGGDSSSVSSKLTSVVRMYTIDYAFAALKNNGAVVTWGFGPYGKCRQGLLTPSAHYARVAACRTTAMRYGAPAPRRRL